MTKTPTFLTPENVAATAHVAGLELAPAGAERIAIALSPAFETFAALAGTLPFDLEPAGFLKAQNAPSNTEAQP